MVPLVWTAISITWRAEDMKRCSRRKQQSQHDSEKPSRFDSYFRIGVSDDYILMRRDFPMEAVSPAEFGKLLTDMFARNDEVRRGK